MENFDRVERITHLTINEKSVGALREEVDSLTELLGTLGQTGEIALLEGAAILGQAFLNVWRREIGLDLGGGFEVGYRLLVLLQQHHHLHRR